MKFDREIVRHLIDGCEGVEIAEAAAVMPVMFMVLLGIFWFGQAFSIYGAITRAAQEGARAGTAPVCATCNAGASPSANATAAIQAALSASKLDPTKARYPVPAPTLAACTPGGPPVGCALGGSTNFCIQNNVQLTPSFGQPALCGMSVSFQYPFQFWLPFTSLNNQTVWILASARVHTEGQ